MKRIISTNKAPKAIGPYSQAVEANGFLFISGQIPINPETNEVVKGGIVEQTEQVLKNIDAILLAAGYVFDSVIKTTCMLKDLKDFQLFNEVYEKYFEKSLPARVTFEVARLPKDVLIEIEVIAA